MVKHALIRYGAFQTFNIKIRVLLEHLCAIWTTAKVHVLPGNQLDGPLEWFFTQAAWADNQIIYFLEVFLGIGGE